MTETGLLLTTEAIDALPAHIAVLDAAGVIVLVNRAWTRFAETHAGGAASGVGANYLAVCRHAALGDDVWAGPAQRGIEEVLLGDREQFVFEYPGTGPGGERWFRMVVTRFDVGPQHYAVVAHDDVTSQKQHERALEESERLLRAVLEALPVGVWILDADGRILQGNAAGMRIWAGARYVRPEAFGEYKGWWLSTGKPIAPDEWAASRAIKKGETSIEEEIEIEAFDGTRKLIANSAVPLVDHANHVTGAIIVNQDISGRKRAEADREALLAEHDRLRRDAEDANRSKDDFIATLSHELRTPLQSVLGWATILKNALADPAAAGRAVAAIERNARVLAQLLDNTLDFNRIVRGTLNLNLSDVELTAIVADVVESMRPAYAEKNVTLADQAMPGSVTVHGDGTRLQQVVWNLLGNALKFTPGGGRAEVSTVSDGTWVEVAVRDNGAGITPEFLPFVFDRFRQSDSGPRAQRAGLGLGLAIVRDLVERHQGTISVESGGAGCGATFVFRLPVVATAVNHAGDR